jgi:predicted PurR-regulated permease PerM
MMIQKITTFSQWILILVGIPAGLYLGRTFLATFMIAVVLALVFGPVMDWLMGKGFSKGWAVATCTLLLFLFFVILGGVLTFQVSLLADDWPRIQRRGLQMIEQAQSLIANQTGLSPQQQVSRLKQNLSSMGSTGIAVFGSFTNSLTNFLLLFVYLVLLLSQRNRFMQFFLDIVDDDKKEDAYKTIFRVRSIASLYVWGKVQVMLALAFTYAIGFAIGGIQYSILLGVIAALFSFIPYVGNILGGGLAALFAVVSGQMSSFFIVVAVMSVAQLLENYILTPFILGDEVNLNPFFSIVSVVVFTMLWGVGGAIVAIPLTAIIKVIFEFSTFTQPAVSLMEQEKKS